jgi:hypothetical protein
MCPKKAPLLRLLIIIHLMHGLIVLFRSVVPQRPDFKDSYNRPLDEQPLMGGNRSWVARTLLETLKKKKLVLDWRKKQQAKADVQVNIDKILDRLPASYTQEVYAQLCIDVFQHVYESYFGQGKNVYAVAS